MSKSSSEIGVLGLGVMGSALSLNFADQGISVSVFNRDEGEESGTVDRFLERSRANHQILGFSDLISFINSLEQPRKVFIMISAGALDSVLDRLIPLLDSGDILMDGGNSHFKLSNERFNLCALRGIEFLGVGVSGGEKGARFGPSIMPGGSKKGFEIAETYLSKIAATDKKDQPCITFVGPEGAGHFVKMVHNGIEYVEMQLLAEVYQLLCHQYDNYQLAELFDQWNHGELGSFLLEITAKIFKRKEGENDLIDLILDKAGNKGTGSWGSISALEMGTENSMMSSAVFARYLSSQKETRQKLGVSPDNDFTKSIIDTENLKKAYAIARRLNHLQGFELIATASKTFDWQINPSEIARIWTNGCIIRSALMEELALRFKNSQSLLEESSFLEGIRNHENALSKTVKAAIDRRVATPAFSSAWNYWTGLTTGTGPANLIQAQRDFFGAHTYQKKNDPNGEFYHTNWEE